MGFVKRCRKHVVRSHLFVILVYVYQQINVSFVEFFSEVVGISRRPLSSFESPLLLRELTVKLTLALRTQQMFNALGLY